MEKILRQKFQKPSPDGVALRNSTADAADAAWALVQQIERVADALEEILVVPGVSLVVPGDGSFVPKERREPEVEAPPVVRNVTLGDLDKMLEGEPEATAVELAVSKVADERLKLTELKRKNREAAEAREKRRDRARRALSPKKKAHKPTSRPKGK